MILSTLADAARVMHGTLHGADMTFRGVSTDTRNIIPGELFVALEGPNFDGSTFVDQASSGDAAGVVASRDIDTGLSLIQVDDTRIGLGQLAQEWRKSMGAKVIGITGSNGKTTLKEMVATCLSLSANTMVTEGNLNNDIGLPLMLLKLADNHKFAVMEMGANHPGEIAYLAALAQSDIVAITNAGPAHLEGFGSIEGVAHAKGEILQTDPRPKCAVLNADDAYIDYWKSLTSDIRIVTFGTSGSADVRASSIEVAESHSNFALTTPEDEVQVDLNLVGAHNVMNACAAAAICSALDIPLQQIKQGLESARPVAGRLRQVVDNDGATVYDDSYNANPDSVVAAAEFLARQAGTSVLVLGDMGELGQQAPELHEHVGRAAKQAGVTRLFACGDLSKNAVSAFGDGGEWFDSVDDLSQALRSGLQPDWNVLIKGSRAMQMERVIDALGRCRRAG